MAAAKESALPAQKLPPRSGGRRGEPSRPPRERLPRRPAPAAGSAATAARETRKVTVPLGPAQGEPAHLVRWPPPPWIAAGSVLLFLILGLLLFDPRLFTGGDNVVYYLLGKALATGQGYVSLYEPGTPQHTLYPPGYPILLVPVFWLFGGSFWAGKALSFAAAMAALALSVRYLRQRLEPRAESGIVFAFALFFMAANSTFLAYSHWKLSDMPYLAVSLGALIFAEGEGRGVKRWLPAALLAACAYLIRTAALPLCAAVTWGVWRRHGRWAGACTAALCLAVVVGWALRNAGADPEGPGYLAQFFAVDPYKPALGTLTATSFAARVVDNLGTYAFLEVPRLVWPFLPALGEPEPLAAYVLGAALVPLLLYGFARQVSRRGLQAGDLYAALYVALLAAWHWKGDRFLLPLLPLLLGYIGLGLVDLVRGGEATRVAAPAPPGDGARGSGFRRVRGGVALLALALALTPNLWHALRRVPAQLSVTLHHLSGDRLAGYQWFERDYFAAAIWLRENAPPEAVVVSRKPQFIYLFSGLKSVLYPYGPPEEIERAVRESRARYLIYDQLGASASYYLRPYLLAYANEYEPAHAVGEPPTMVLARVGSPGSPGPAQRGLPER